MADETATPSDSDATARYWLDQLKLAEREEEDWRKEARKIVERFRDEKDRRGVRLNIFAANVQLLQPNVYGQTPVPDVRRRNIREEANAQALGRQVATVIDRALSFTLDDHPFDEEMEAVRDDLLLTGRGVSRVMYEAKIVKRTDIQVEQPPAPMMVMPDEMGMPVEVPVGPPPPPVYLLEGQPIEPQFDKDGAAYLEQKTEERVWAQQVFWADYRQAPARSWRDVWWQAFRHTMTRKELVKEFGGIGRKVTLDIGSEEGQSRSSSPDPVTGSPKDAPSREGRAEVWEVWNKRTSERIWVSPGHKDILRTDPDPLGLRDFFPAPRPVYSIQTTETLVPLPEFQLYRDQADEVDELQSRIQHLERVLKAVPLVAGDFTEVKDIAKCSDGVFIPVTRPDVSIGSLDADIWWWPLDKIITTIQTLQQRVAELKQQIWEITGLHDLQRGATKERETAAAQRMKGAFGQIRMSPRSLPMARHVRDLYRLMAEVMAEHFDQATLERISGEMVTPEMMALLREEKVRNTSISVASDATVRPDIHAEREEANEFLAASTGFLQQVAAVAGVMPPVVPLMMETFRQAARTYKWSRVVEPMIDQTVAMITQQVQQQIAMQQQQLMMQQQAAQMQAAGGAPPNGAGQPGVMQ